MLQLNADQQQAAADFIGFMLSNDKELVISGGAGVGKTTLLRHLMSMQDTKFAAALINKKPIQNWALTATTNKAAEVLGMATGRNASTIHSFLGLRVQNDFSTGSTKIKRSPKSEVITDTVIVIDECSMVDSQLYRLIQECTYNCKIVYVGDHCQMAPVMESLSPVFANNDPIVLNTIIRSQHTPAITALCKQLRETVETGVFQPMAGEPGVIDYLSPQEAEEEINRIFLGEEHADARILCYTNNKVLRFNHHLRTLRDLPTEFTEGEWVVSNSMSYGVGQGKQAPTLRVEQELRIDGVEESKPYEFEVGRAFFELPIYLVRSGGAQFRIPQDITQYRDLVKELGRVKNWGPYFTLKEMISDLRPRDACTVYKAQGSTYHTVFVDLQDIGTCTNAAQAARMLYVACSRPTHRICFIGQLPDRFRGE